MTNGIDGKTEERAPGLRICVSGQESVSGPDQGSSEESRDIREAKNRHPSKRFEPVRSSEYFGELPSRR